MNELVLVAALLGPHDLKQNQHQECPQTIEVQYEANQLHVLPEKQIWDFGEVRGQTQVQPAFNSRAKTRTRIVRTEVKFQEGICYSVMESMISGQVPGCTWHTHRSLKFQGENLSFTFPADSNKSPNWLYNPLIVCDYQ